MYSCPTLEKSAVQPKTTSLCSSITVITLWYLPRRIAMLHRGRDSQRGHNTSPGSRVDPRNGTEVLGEWPNPGQCTGWWRAPMQR